MPAELEPQGNGMNGGKDADVLAPLEPDQLTAARAKPYPRRKLKRREILLFWALRIYLLFMLGVVFYQVWAGIR